MRNYKYKPENFKGMNRLGEDLRDFYQALETNQEQHTQSSEIELWAQRQNIFFSIKHRWVEGHFNEVVRDELYEYLGGLLDD